MANLSYGGAAICLCGAAIKLFGGDFLSFSAYIAACFDLLFDVLKHADNILVFLPFASLVICFVFTLVFRMIRGKYYG